MRTIVATEAMPVVLMVANLLGGTAHLNVKPVTLTTAETELNCRNRTAVSVPSNARCTSYYSDCSSKCSKWACNSGYEPTPYDTCIKSCTPDYSLVNDNPPCGCSKWGKIDIGCGVKVRSCMYEKACATGGLSGNNNWGSSCASGDASCSLIW